MAKKISESDARRYALSDFHEARAIAAEDTLNQEPTVETEWGTAAISSRSSGVASAREAIREAVAQQTYDETPLTDTVLSAFKSPEHLVGGSIYKAYLDSKAGTEDDYDPDFNVDEAIKQDAIFYNEEDRDFLRKAVSSKEYYNRKNLLMERDMSLAKLADMGGYGVAAQLAAGMFDIDMLIPGSKAVTFSNRVKKLRGAIKYAKEGTELSKLKRAVAITKARQVADPIATAAVSNAASEMLRAAMGADVDIDDIGDAALSGLAMGATLSAGAHYLGNTKDVGDFTYNQKVLDTILERKGATTLGQKYDALDSVEEITTLHSVSKARKDLYNVDKKGNKTRKTLKEIDSTAPDDIVNINASDRIKDIVEASYLANKETAAKRKKAYEFIDDADKNLMRSKGFEKFVNTTFGKPEYTEAVESGNIVLQAAAHDLIADPTNYVSNVNNAESVTDLVRTKARGYLQSAEDNFYNNYVKESTKGLDKVTAFKNRFFGKMRDDFTEEVYLEANSRELYKSNFSADNNIKGYVDNITEMSSYLLDELKDTYHNGVDMVDGVRDIEKTSYIPRRWDMFNLRRKQGELGEDYVKSVFAESIKRGYAAKGLTIEDAKAKIFAKAIIDNAVNRDTGKPFNTSLTNENAVLMLIENGIDPKEANAMVDAIFKQTADKNIPKFAKDRIPMDYSVQFADGSTIASLLDKDLQKVMSGYVNNASGRVGLARVGYHSDAEFAALVDAANFMDGELMKKGKQIKRSAKQQLEEFKSRLLGYPLETESPWAQRLINAGNLFMMNMAGITQFVEFAPQMAAFGIRHTLGNSLEVIKEKFGKGERISMLDDIESFAGGAFFDDYTLNSVNIENLDLDNIPKSHWIWGHVDYLLKKGLTHQQAWNLLRPTIVLQRKAAVMSMMNNLADIISQNKFDDVKARLSDWGITDELYSKVLNNWKNVELTKRGQVHNLHLNKWDYDVANEFTRAIRRAMDTLVQKPRLGEQRRWISTGMGRFIGQYKTYPLLAANKYSVRGLRHMDAEAINTLLISLSLSPLVYAAKVQATTADPAERANKMTFDKVVYNALSYNVNLGSFIEPVSILGDLIGVKTSPYSRGTFEAAEYIAPSLNALPVLAAPIKASVQKATKGELNKQTFKQLQQATIAGNMLGISRFYEYVFGAPLSRDAKKIKRSMEQAAKAKETKVSKAVETVTDMVEAPKQDTSADIQKASTELQELVNPI